MSSPARAAPPRVDASHDARLRARRRARRRRARSRGAASRSRAVATPGHAANHLCFALLEENALFSGDHVMAWSTSVVAPPDGSMARLYGVAGKGRAAQRGDLLARPRRAGARPATLRARARSSHRRQREAGDPGAARGGRGDDRRKSSPGSTPGSSPALIGAASLSTLAHLEDLAERGVVASDGAIALSARFRRA